MSADLSRVRVVLISLGESLNGRASGRAAGAGGFEPGDRSFPDEIALELGVREDVEERTDRVGR